MPTLADTFFEWYVALTDPGQRAMVDRIFSVLLKPVETGMGIASDWMRTSVGIHLGEKRADSAAKVARLKTETAAHNAEVLALSEAKTQGIKADAAARLAERKALAKIKLAQIRKLGSSPDMGKLEDRAALRGAAQELQQQANTEDIIILAANSLPQGAKPQEIDSGWLEMFLKKCKDQNEVRMKEVWAKVLQAEAVNPGGFSFRFLTELADMAYEEVMTFEAFCGTVMTIDGVPRPVVVDLEDIVYRGAGVYLTSVINLDSIGLVAYSDYREHSLRPTNNDGVFWVQYWDHGRRVGLPLPRLQGAPPSEPGLRVGGVAFTLVGSQLYKVICPKEIPGLWELVSRYWLGPRWAPTPEA